MEETQMLTLNPTWHSRLQVDFRSACITDDETCQALLHTYNAYDHFVDPHTAVALSAAEKLGYPVFDKSTKEGNPVVILATASPCKFQEAVTTALGENGWDKYRKTGFPARALQTIASKEKDPHHFSWEEGATLSEVQSVWQKKMLQIVEKSFSSKHIKV